MFLKKIIKKIKTSKLCKFLTSFFNFVSFSPEMVDVDPLYEDDYCFYNSISVLDLATAKESLILKLNKVYKQGYLPSRKGESYNWVRKSDYEHVETLFNCFAHACFNLTNEIILEQNFTKAETIVFGAFYDNKLSNHELFESDFFNFINQTGLQVQVCSPTEKLDSNQWKVALMFEKENLDFHFLLQEKNGSWSGKRGRTKKVDRFPALPNEYSTGNVRCYELYKTYSITNPNAKIPAQTSKNTKEKAD